MNYSVIQWTGAYKAYLKSGLTKADFYRGAFKKFCPSGIPALATMYAHFQQLDKASKAPAAKRSVKHAAKPVTKSVTSAKPTSPAVRVVSLSAEDISRGLRACGEESFRHAPRHAAPPAPLRPFRVQLPNGTRLEFDSVAPEALALRMVYFAGGAS